MDCQIKITDDKTVWRIRAASALTFLFNLFLGVLSILFFVFVSKEKSMVFYLVIILTLFMWCLQSIRSFHSGEPSDWVGNYYYNLHNAAVIDTLTYLFFTTKEYVWQAFNLIGYYLFDGNFLSYANFIVTLIYTFTLAAIYKFWNYVQADPRFLVASLCLFAFVTEVSGICNNLLRQQFAISMMLYVIIKKCINGRTPYPLLIISFLTHAMTGFFIPFLFIRLGKRAFSCFCIYIISGFGLSYILFTNLSISSSSSSYASQWLVIALNTYALKDIIQPSTVYPFLAVTVIPYVKVFFFDSERRKCELYINNLSLILILMCPFMASMSLMQTRYFIIRFFSIPLVVPYFFTVRGSLCDYYLITVPLCFVFRFFSTPSIWLASSNDIVYRSVFDYL